MVKRPVGCRGNLSAARGTGRRKSGGSSSVGNDADAQPFGASRSGGSAARVKRDAKQLRRRVCHRVPRMRPLIFANTSTGAQTMRRRRRHFIVIIITQIALALVLVGQASATHWFTNTYFSGYLSPNQGDATGHYYCNELWQSRASWSFGPYMTVAIITPSGGWVASSRSNSGSVSTTIGSGLGYKAHCKNSDASSTFFVTCRADIYYQHGSCA